MRQMYLSIQWRAGHQIKGAVSHQCGKCIVHTMACWASDQSDISFVFRTESGVRAPGGFQCRLVDEEAVANDEDGEVLVDEGTVANDKDGEELVAFTEQLHDWRTCNSPAEYTGMPDHVYRFQASFVCLLNDASGSIFGCESGTNYYSP
eukprot:1157749-Pelagomonas_calceolata.AAC.4